MRVLKVREELLSRLDLIENAILTVSKAESRIIRKNAIILRSESFIGSLIYLSGYVTISIVLTL